MYPHGARARALSVALSAGLLAAGLVGTLASPARAAGQLTLTPASSNVIADAAVPVTISAPSKAIGGQKIHLTGTADPGAAVDILVQRTVTPGLATFVKAATVTAGKSGTWALGTTMKQTSWFQASVNGTTAAADPALVTVTSALDVKAKAQGSGKVRFTVNGHPDVRGYANVYYNGTRLGHVRTDSKGDAEVTVQSSPGRKTFELYFQAPGCLLGTRSLTGTVK